MPQPPKYPQVQVIVSRQNLSNKLPRHGIPALPHSQRIETQSLKLTRDNCRRDLKCSDLYAQKERFSQGFETSKHTVLKGRESN